jgi:hypothetical protein
VANHYSIAMRGKQRPKVKDIEGGLATMEVQAEVQEKIFETNDPRNYQYYNSGVPN